MTAVVGRLVLELFGPSLVALRLTGVIAGHARDRPRGALRARARRRLPQPAARLAAVRAHPVRPRPRRPLPPDDARCPGLGRVLLRRAADPRTPRASPPPVARTDRGHRARDQGHRRRAAGRLHGLPDRVRPTFAVPRSRARGWEPASRSSASSRTSAGRSPTAGRAGSSSGARPRRPPRTPHTSSTSSSRSRSSAGALPLVAVGVVSLWRRRPLRALSLLAPLVSVLYLVEQGRSYYALPAAGLPLAAGVVVAGRWLQPTPRRLAAVAAVVALQLAALVARRAPRLAGAARAHHDRSRRLAATRSTRTRSAGPSS